MKGCLLSDAGAAFNRTIVELKLRLLRLRFLPVQPFNRTIVELKPR